MGTPKLEARSLCRNLERHGVVKCIMEDEGRQRVTKYVAWEYEAQSELSLKFEQEKQKIMELSRKAGGGNTVSWWDEKLVWFVALMVVVEVYGQTFTH